MRISFKVCNSELKVEGVNMSEKSVDLSSTPAEGTRFKSRQGKSANMAKDKRNKEVFKVPSLPFQVKSKSVQRIRSVAERKCDLLSKWGEGVTVEFSNGVKGLDDKVGGTANNIITGDNERRKSTIAKLAQFRYKNDTEEEDNISLAESAKITQAKMRRVVYGDESDYNESEDHDNASLLRDTQDDHDENAGSDAGTRHTEISEAHSNIAEQAEIVERKELEEMKQKVQQDTPVEEVLRYVLEKLTMMQIGLKELKTEQSNMAQKIHNLNDMDNRLKRNVNFSIQ